MLNGVLWKQFFMSALYPGLYGRAYEVVKQERTVHEQRKPNHLKPLERLPAQSQRNDPDKKSAASIDSGPRSRTDCTSDRQSKEVEAAVVWLAGVERNGIHKRTYPMLIMINTLLTAIARKCVIS